MTSKQQTTGTHTKLSLNLNASFTICQTKRPNFRSKSQGSPIFGCFLISFFDGFFPSAFGASRKRLSGGTPRCSPRRRHPPGGPGRRRPGAAALPPRGSGARARERSVFRWSVASKNGWIATPGVVGGRCQKKSNSLKFGVNRNLDYFSMLVYVWIWTSRLLMITNEFAICPCDQREMNTWSWGDDEE